MRIKEIVIRFSTFEAIVECGTLSDDEKSQLYDIATFLQSLDAMFKESDKTSSQRPESGKDATQPTESGVTTEIYQLQRAEVSLVNGAPQVKLCGGKFEKYGVPLYWDTASRDEAAANWLQLISKKAGVHTPLQDFTFAVMLVNGKPKRVKSVWLTSSREGNGDLPF